MAGAELFTGNNLIVMAWADRRITTGELLRNWSIVYFANFAGSVAAAYMVWGGDIYGIGGGKVAETAIAIAQGKVALPYHVALLRGVMCNVLVCLAVWLCYAANSLPGKILALIFPIAAFVALGFEHSVANMFLIPVGMLYGAEGVTLGGMASNLIPATIGNMIGGGAFVAGVYWAGVYWAGVYWAIYIRKPG